MEKQSGFTLVELVVVIVILGILAAYAVPKYMNIDKEARIAVVKGFEGSVRSASDIVYALSVAKGKLGGTDPTDLDVGNGIVKIRTNGYPTPDVDGISSALNDTSGFDEVIDAPNNKIRYEKIGSPNKATCSVSYTNAGTVNTPPTIVRLTDGC